MKKQIELLGMSFPNYSLREEVLLAQEALKDNKLQVFLTVSMRSLMKASSMDVVKDCVEKAQLVIVDDQEILKVAGINSSQRVREAEDHLFFAEFLKRLVRGHGTVYLVATKDAALEKIKEILSEQYENLDIVGEYSIEQYPDDLDRMINDINGCAPDVIISVMPTPQQEEFLQSNRNKLDAKVWYGLGEFYSLLNEKHGFGWRMKRLIHFGRFKMHVNQYEDKEEK
ncbi:MAG: WecB/TagA/CpsF family glycosyltransferase [bacterium]|nr:WecB/TagA/CpsF family glycosyltransferase [bacterium]